MNDVLISMGIAAIIQSVKNEEARKKMRRAFLKVFKALWLPFQEDPEFRAVVGLETDDAG